MTRYEEKGYKDRNDYLDNLAKDFGVSRNAVQSLADLFGPKEDFDGLVSAIWDMSDVYYE